MAVVGKKCRVLQTRAVGISMKKQHHKKRSKIPKSSHMQKVGLVIEGIGQSCGFFSFIFLIFSFLFSLAFTLLL